MGIQRTGHASLLTSMVSAGVATPAWACSGPGAMEAIIRSELIGWALFSLTAILAATSVIVARHRLRRLWLVPLVLLALLHPGWWMSARSGDCGHTLVLASVLFSILTAGFSGLLLWRSRRVTARTTR